MVELQGEQIFAADGVVGDMFELSAIRFYGFVGFVALSKNIAKLTEHLVVLLGEYQSLVINTAWPFPGRRVRDFSRLC
jgi:hypothetical protein